MGEINTKFVEHEYDYVKPASLDEALDILAEKKEKAKIYAGGTDLLVHLKMGKGEDVRMETLIRVCHVLNCKIDDIIDYDTN